MVFLVITVSLMAFFIIGYCIIEAIRITVQSDKWSHRIIGIIGLLAIIGELIMMFMQL